MCGCIIKEKTNLVLPAQKLLNLMSPSWTLHKHVAGFSSVPKWVNADDQRAKLLGFLLFVFWELFLVERYRSLIYIRCKHLHVVELYHSCRAEVPATIQSQSKRFGVISSVVLLWKPRECKTRPVRTVSLGVCCLRRELLGMARPPARLHLG